MSYAIQGDVNDNLIISKKISKLQRKLDDIYIPVYEDNSKPSSVSTTSSTTTSTLPPPDIPVQVSKTGRIKNYEFVTGIVELDLDYETHKMTLDGDVIIRFTGDIDSDFRKDIVIEIIQQTGNEYVVSWPDSVKTLGSITISSDDSFDIENKIGGYTSDGGISWNLGDIGAKRIVVSGDFYDQINDFLNDPQRVGLKWINDNYESIKSNLENATDWINNAAKNVSDIFSTLSDSIESALGDTYSNIKTVLDGITTPINTWLQNQGDVITTALGDTYSNIKNVLGDITTPINEWLQEQGDTIKGTLGDAWNWLNGISSTIRSQITSAATWVNNATLNVRSLISSSKTQIISALGTVGTWLDDLGTTTISQITSAASWVNNASQNVIELINNSLGDAWDWLNDLSANVRDQITTSAGLIADQIGEITNQINSWYNDTTKSGLRWANNISSTVRSQITSAATWVNNASQNVIELINNSLGDAWDWLNDLTFTTRSRITLAATWINSASANVRSLISSSKTQIISALGSVGDWIDNLTFTTRSRITSAATWVNNATLNVRSLISNSQSSIETALGTSYSRIKTFLNGLIGTIDSWFNDKGVLSGISSSISNALKNITGGSLPTDYDIIVGNSDDDSQRGSNGDVDLKTYDLVNVDRIFFNSNDSLNTSSTYPHITGKNGSSSRSLNLFAPSLMQFFIGSTNVFNFERNKMYALKELFANDNIIASEDIEIYDNCIIRESQNTGFRPSGQTNKIILFGVPTSSGKTELRAQFQTGGSVVVAIQP